MTKFRIMTGDYGYCMQKNNEYYVYGCRSPQGVCYKADKNYWSTQKDFESLPDDFPLYCPETIIKQDIHDIYESKHDLIVSAKVALKDYNLKPTKNRIYYLVEMALTICDWQSCERYIENELIDEEIKEHLSQLN